MREEARNLAGAAASASPDDLAHAVDRENRRRFDSFLAGVETYRRHPYRRDLADPPAVWRQGTTSLRDYGESVRREGRRGGIPVLVVPSLINRGYILDLSAGRSFLRWLVGRGFRPFLVDWDAPGEAERRFDLTDYVAGRLEAALNVVLDATGGRPVAVLGYCMGGLLALALAQRRRREVSRLALLATPWDFHAERAEHARAMAGLGALLEGPMALTGALHVDLLQGLFNAFDPFLVERKFAAFGTLDPDSAKARDFVALEDWLNDGVPLAAPVARECLVGWYGRNTPARGAWRIGGAPVEPAAFDRPALVVVPARDRIVPPGSASALAAALPEARMLTPGAGHIGMIVGNGTTAAVWEPLAAWLKQGSGRRRADG